MIPFRIGLGYDVHAFADNRPLWLGGVLISHTGGLAGHSDADVLLHAICDAILGAVALGDIGIQFPNTDPQYKDIDSKILLRHTYGLIRKKGFDIVNIDATVIAEKPKIAPYVPEMCNAIAGCIQAFPEIISIKATTNERMGFIGRGEGIAAMAVALLNKSSE
jgi:2-C-methyl-D-erythritol 2,4-cyclodiphosphate synthase